MRGIASRIPRLNPAGSSTARLRKGCINLGARAISFSASFLSESGRAVWLRNASPASLATRSGRDCGAPEEGDVFVTVTLRDAVDLPFGSVISGAAAAIRKYTRLDIR